jgi:hypothetical protein
MGNYDPSIPPAVVWDNRFSIAFCDLLSICAAAKVVFVLPVGTTMADGERITTPVTMTCVSPSCRPAALLMTRELISRLNTGSSVSQPNYDFLVDPGNVPVGPAVANEFAERGTAPRYPHRGELGRFSIPVPRVTGLDSSDLFVQSDCVAAYQVELASVLAAATQLVADVAAQAALNVAQDPTAAATVAAALAASRAAYVTQLQAAYPTRGYA